MMKFNSHSSGRNSFFLLFAFLMLTIGQLKAQSTANYTPTNYNNGSLVLDMNGNTIDMTGANQLLASGIDDANSALTDIGFDFFFMGARYSQFAVNDNGVMSLGATPGTGTYAVPNSAIPTLAVFGNDMRTGTNGAVQSKVFGTVGSRVLVVEWTNNMVRYLTTAAAGTATFQARIYERTGVIEYVYGTMTTNAAAPSVYYIGFSNAASANKVVTVNATTNATNTTTTTTSNTYTASSTITALSSAADGSRKMYRFTPPTTNLAPTGTITFGTVTQVAMTLSGWTNNVTSNLNTVLYNSTDNVNFNYAGATANATATTFTASGLTPGQTYYWKLYSVSEGNLVGGTLTGSQATPGYTNFYSKATGNLDVLGTWGTNTDGTGTAPTSFTTAYQQFNVRNNPTPTISAGWTLSSTSKIIVGDGTNACNFTVGFNIGNATVDVSANATVTLTSTNYPAFGTLNNTSTVNYASTGAQVVQAYNYGNLTLSSTGARTFTGVAGVSNVFNPGTITTAAAGTINFTSAGAQTIPPFSYATLTSTGNGARTLGTSGNIIIKTAFTPGTGAYTVTGSTVEFANTATGVIVPVLNPAGTYNYNNLLISGSGGSTTGGNISLGGNFTQTNGTFTLGGNTTIAGNFTQSAGTFNVVNAFTSQTLSVTGNFIFSGGTFVGTASSTTSGATATITVGGTYTQTLTSYLRLVASSSSGNATFTVNGAVSINPSTTYGVNLEYTANTAAAGVFQANGNVTFSGAGTRWIDFGTGTVTGNAFKIKGDLSITGSGNFYTSGTSTGAYIQFNGTGTLAAPQKLSYASTTNSDYTSYLIDATTAVQLQQNLTISNTTTPTSSFNVNGILDAQSYLLVCAGTSGGFNLNAGGTLVTANTNGVYSGTLGTVSANMVATAVFNAGANYIFNGTSAQTTNFKVASQVANNITFDNTAGVTINGTSSGPTVAGTLNLVNGKITTGTNTISVSNSSTGAINRANGYVVGNLKRAVASGSNSYSFPIGTTGSYAPLNLAYNSVTTPGSVTASATAGQNANTGSPINTSKDVNLYWTLTNSGIVATDYSPTFAYNTGDIIGGAVQSNFVVGNYNSGWSAGIAATNAGAGPYTTTIAGQTTYGDFAIGELNSSPVLGATTLGAFGALCTGTTATGSFSLAGSNGLTSADVTVGPLSGYTFSSTSGSGYVSILTLPTSAGTVTSPTVYVLFSPTLVQSYNGSIPVNGGGATGITVTTSGSGINTAPTVTTPTSTAITSTTATLGGNATVLGCTNITERGIYWSTTNGFTPPGQGTLVSTTGTFATGVFTQAVTGLPSSSTIYFKAFATNAGGTGFSAQASFTTPVAPPSCATQTLPASSATGLCPYNVSFSWTAPVTGTTPAGYKLYLGTDGGGTVLPTNTVNGVNTGNVLTYTSATALTGGATYYWAIVPTNAGGDATGCTIRSFTTTTVPSSTTPVTQNFEGCVDWVVVNGTANKWVNGTATANGGTKSMYISNDNGVTNDYTTASYATSHFYKDVTFPAGQTNITFTFDYKARGESGYDRLLVYIAPTTVTPVAGSPASNSTTLTGATLLYTQATYTATSGSTWANISVPITGTQAGNASAASTMRLIFTWQNDDGGGTTPPAAVDNISITSAVPPPTLTSSAVSLTFGNVCTNASSTAGSNSFSLTNSTSLTSSVTVGPLTGYTFSSASAGTYTSTLVLPVSGGTVTSPTVYVRLSPTAVQSYSGSIPVSGGGATSINVTATGAGVNTAPTVTASAATGITAAGATVPGTITITGCTAVTAYGVEYSTTSGFTTGTGTQVASSNLSGTAFSSALTGLADATTYYYRTYATNSGGTSYSTQTSFTTTCGVASVPYAQNFDGVTTPTIPVCWSILNANSDSYTWTTTTTLPSGGLGLGSSPNALTCPWNANGTTASDDWAFSKGIALTGGTSYRFTFKYAARDTYKQGLEVKYGTAATVAGMTSTIFTIANFQTPNYTFVSRTFTPATTGTYYIGIHDNSPADGFGVFVDDVTVDLLSPILVSSSVSATFGNTCINTTSATTGSFSLVNSSDLTSANVTVGPLTGFTFSSASGGTYTSTLAIPTSGGTVTAPTVYVKFTPILAQSYSGNIPVSGGGASSINVAETGTGINTPPTVTTAAASAITTSTATVPGTITSNGCSAVTAYGVEYSTTTGFANGSGTQVPSSNLTSGAFSSGLSSLASNTTYYYHAYATNGGGTSYSSQGSFTTACTAFTLGAATPMFEGFNATSLNSCWSTTVVTPATTTPALTYVASSTSPTAAPYEGGYFVKFNSLPLGTNGGQLRLVSRAVNTLTNAVPSVDVQFAWFNENNTTYSAGNYLNEGVTVQYSIDGGVTWLNYANNYFARHDGTLAAGTGQWNYKTSTLPTNAGNQANLLIGFLFTSKSGDYTYLDAANIKVTTAPSCVTGLTPANGAVTVTNGPLSWTAAASATSYDVYLSTVQSDVNSELAAAFVGNVTATSYTPTGMTAGTYYWKVVAKNIIGSATGCATSSFTAQAPLCGAYTINNTVATGGTNFNNFTDAFNVLNAVGVSCGTTFSVKDGQTFNALLPTLTATGTAANTITFARDNSTATRPKIVGTTGSGASDAVVRISGGDYITFDGIDIADNSANTTAVTRMEYGFYLNGLATNGCKFDTLKNSTVTLNVANTNTTYGVYSISAATATSGSNSNNMFLSNTVQNATLGYLFTGSSTAYDTGNKIDKDVSGGNSVIQNIGTSTLAASAAGIAMSYQTGASISNTTVTNINSGSYGAYAIDLVNGTSSSLTIADCNISNVKSISSEAAGILVEDGADHNFLRNTIQNISAATIAAGIYSVTDGINTCTGNTIGGAGSLGITAAGDYAFGLYSDIGTLRATQNTITNVIGTGDYTFVYGIIVDELSDNSYTQSIQRNTVSSIKNTNTLSEASVSGISVSAYFSSTKSLVANNYVSDIRNDNGDGYSAPDVRGISILNTYSAIYYNTVTLTGTSANSGFEAAALYIVNASDVDTVSNNILYNSYNVTTGTRASAFFFDGSNSQYASYIHSSSNNNLLYAGATPSAKNTIYHSTTNNRQTLALYQAMAAPAESASVTGLVKFVNTTTLPYDLHADSTTNCLINGKGKNLAASGLTIDFDGQTRATGTAPNGSDIGADEFNLNAQTKSTIVSNPVCVGSALTITASTNAPTPTYAWSVPTGITNPGAASSYSTASVTSANAGHYVVTVTDLLGCTTTFDSVITVNALPGTFSYTPNPANILTGGTGANITVTSAGTTSFAWSPSTGLSATTGASVNANPTSTTSYTVLATTANGCTTSNTVTVNVSCGVNVWTGAINNDWFNAANWACGVVPTSTIDATIPNSAVVYPVISGTVGQVATARNVTIAGGANVTVLGTNAVNLDVYGNFSNVGAPSLGNGKVVFKGTSNQTVSGTNIFNNVEVNNTSGVTIATGSGNMQTVRAVLTLNKGTLTTNGNLTIASSSAGTGLVDNFTGTNSGTISGNLTVQRYVVNPGTNFFYVGSPVGGGTVADWNADFNNSPVNGALDGSQVNPTNTCNPTALNYGSPYGSLFDYRENTVRSCNLQGWHTRFSGFALNGQGFAARIPNNTTIDMTGSFNNGGIISPNLTRTALNATQSIGFNLIANPYVAPIDWLDVAAANQNIEGTAYMYETQGGLAGTYLPVNAISGSTQIATSQAFFVYNKVGQATTNVTFTGGARRNGTNGYLRTSRPYEHMLTLDVAGNGFADKARIAFGNNFTNGFDADYDAHKIKSVDGQPSIFVTEGADEYSIYAQTSPDEVKQVPVSLEPGVAGNFTITASDLGTFDANTMVTLEDLKLHITQDLTVNPIYSFTSTENDNAARFIVHFAAKTAGVPTVSTESSVKISGYSNEVRVNFQNFTALDEVTMNVYDVTGRKVIASQQLATGTSTASFKLSDIVTGYFFVVLTGNGYEKAEKVFLSSDN